MVAAGSSFWFDVALFWGVESGASVFDFTGELEGTVEHAMRRNPALEFEEVSQQYLANLDGQIRLNQISPRCFEAAALRTVMVMYPGEYSGRLEAWRHYIPLAKDHSNMEEVIAALGDASLIDKMSERAYEEVALAPENSYNAFVDKVDKQLAGAFKPSMAASTRPTTNGRLSRCVCDNSCRTRNAFGVQ